MGTSVFGGRYVMWLYCVELMSVGMGMITSTDNALDVTTNRFLHAPKARVHADKCKKLNLSVFHFADMHVFGDEDELYYSKLSESVRVLKSDIDGVALCVQSDVYDNLFRAKITESVERELQKFGATVVARFIWNAIAMWKEEINVASLKLKLLTELGSLSEAMMVARILDYHPVGEDLRLTILQRLSLTVAEYVFGNELGQVNEADLISSPSPKANYRGLGSDASSTGESSGSSGSIVLGHGSSAGETLAPPPMSGIGTLPPPPMSGIGQQLAMAAKKRKIKDIVISPRTAQREALPSESSEMETLLQLNDVKLIKLVLLRFSSSLSGGDAFLIPTSKNQMILNLDLFVNELVRNYCGRYSGTEILLNLYKLLRKTSDDFEDNTQRMHHLFPHLVKRAFLSHLKGKIANHLRKLFVLFGKAGFTELGIVLLPCEMGVLVRAGLNLPNLSRLDLSFLPPHAQDAELFVQAESVYYARHQIDPLEEEEGNLRSLGSTLRAFGKSLKQCELAIAHPKYAATVVDALPLTLEKLILNIQPSYENEFFVKLTKSLKRFTSLEVLGLNFDENVEKIDRRSTEQRNFDLEALSIASSSDRFGGGSNSQKSSPDSKSSSPMTSPDFTISRSQSSFKLSETKVATPPSTKGLRSMLKRQKPNSSPDLRSLGSSRSLFAHQELPIPVGFYFRDRASSNSLSHLLLNLPPAKFLYIKPSRSIFEHEEDLFPAIQDSLSSSHIEELFIDMTRTPYAARLKSSPELNALSKNMRWTSTLKNITIRTYPPLPHQHYGTNFSEIQERGIREFVQNLSDKLNKFDEKPKKLIIHMVEGMFNASQTHSLPDSIAENYFCERLVSLSMDFLQLRDSVKAGPISIIQNGVTTAGSTYDTVMGRQGESESSVRYWYSLN